jgi:hypothetical protein
MVYTIASLYGIGCAYRHEWEHPLEKCSGGSQWIIPFVFSAIPSLIRLVQCIKRYNDSGLVHHLVNVGSDILVLWSERLIRRYREENIQLVLYITSYIYTGGIEVRTPSR